MLNWQSEDNFSPEKMISWWSQMLKIRLTEDFISEKYHEQQMRTAVHLGTGQEAIPVGICSALIELDAVYTQHRSHNHFLASGGSVFSLFAELHGSKLGSSGGRGGSVHLTHSNSLFFASTAILGQSVSLAVGSALTFKLRKQRNVGVTFFGDAVWEEGVIYESLNFASIHSLPVIFVCENNGYSTESTFISRKGKNSNFKSRAESFGLESFEVDGNDVLKIANLAGPLIQNIRENPRPVYIEAKTYRLREHVGPNFDHEVGRKFRTKEEFLLWQGKDPIKRCRQKLLQYFTDVYLDQVSLDLSNEIKAEFSRASDAKKPEPSELFMNSGEV
jgi:pyruvate dehydrogenase E1 component alpha subunit